MPKTVPTIELNVNSKPIRLSMYYSVCKNPDCDCNGINIALANESYEIAFFIDFGTGSYTESANKNKVYSKEDTDIINAFIVFINSSENKKYSLDFFKKYYKEIKERQKAKKAAIGSFNVGELMPYLDIFWSEKALSLAMNGKDYDIIDYYCVTPDCNCTEIELEFYERPFKVGFRRSDFSFIYDYEEKRAIEIKGISYGQAESIILGFTEKTNEIFRKRHKKLKSEVEPCILEKLSKYKRVNVSKRTNVSGRPTRKLGRNEPCHCGSGKKYKKCCLDRDMQERSGAMRVAEF